MAAAWDGQVSIHSQGRAFHGRCNSFGISWDSSNQVPAYHPAIRLLTVEHVDENDKACLYLVRQIKAVCAHACLGGACACVYVCACACACVCVYICPTGSNIHPECCSVWVCCGWYCGASCTKVLLCCTALSWSLILTKPFIAIKRTVAQVFEYLTTDLKRYMDRNGKGPAYPLPTQTVKVLALLRP